MFEGEKGDISPAYFRNWGEIEGKNRGKNLLKPSDEMKYFSFIKMLEGVFVIYGMIHAYCDLYSLIDFNWLLLVTQMFSSNVSSIEQLS